MTVALNSKIIGLTDCHASGPDAPYGGRYVVPSLAGMWTKPILAEVYRPIADKVGSEDMGKES